MSFEQELKVLLEYCDYSNEESVLIENEIKMVHQVYPDLIPNRGWGSHADHTVSLTGFLVVEKNTRPIKIPFGICYPVGYPIKPPLCSIITKKNDVILSSSQDIDSLGNFFVEAFRNWSPSNDSFEVISQCIEAICKYMPLKNLEEVYLNEMWRVRKQIDEVNQDKRALKKKAEEIKQAEINLAHMINNIVLQNMEHRCTTLRSFLTNISAELTLEDMFEYKSAYAKQILNVTAEMEAADEVLLKLEEAFTHKVITATDYVFSLKRVHQRKFLLSKLRSKIISLL